MEIEPAEHVAPVTASTPTKAAPVQLPTTRRTKTGPERQLESSLWAVRRELLRCEIQLHQVDRKQQRLQRTLKRSREGPEDTPEEPPQKRLRSAIVAPVNQPTTTSEPPKIEESTESRRPAIQNNEEDKRRNRRLLGSLLVGTLRTFRQESTKEEDSKVRQTRMELEQAIESKVTSETTRLAEQQYEESVSQRTRLQEKFDASIKLVSEKENELWAIREERTQWLLSGFARTATTPAIYFLPKKIDDWTKENFNLAPRAPRQVHEEEVEDGGDEGEKQDEVQEVYSSSEEVDEVVAPIDS